MARPQILLDTYRHQAQQWCWREDWHVRGESAWTLFWKFAQLNQLTARELATVITNRTSGRRTAICAKPDVDLRDASALDLDLLGKMFRVQPATARQAFLYEILPGSVLRSHDYLRWCDQCLNRGFHSPLFQMRLTATCPVHDHTLRDACPSCARQIPYRLNNAFVLKPFQCPHCDFRFTRALSDGRPEILRLRQEHILNLSRLLKFYQAADVDLVNANDVNRLFISARKAGIFHVNVDEADTQCRYASFIAQVVHEVSPGQYWQPDGLRFDPVERYVSACRSSDLPDDDEQCPDFDRGDAVESSRFVSQACLAAIVDTYKAIRRRLWQKVLKKHQCCIRCTATRMELLMEGDRAEGLCPYALTFIRWRMLWEGRGTSRYLFVPPANDYYGISGWHLARGLALYLTIGRLLQRPGSQVIFSVQPALLPLTRYSDGQNQRARRALLTGPSVRIRSITPASGLSRAGTALASLQLCICVGQTHPVSLLIWPIRSPQICHVTRLTSNILNGRGVGLHGQTSDRQRMTSAR